MSLSYSHPQDLYEYAKSIDRKLSTIIELLTLLKENNETKSSTNTNN